MNEEQNMSEISLTPATGSPILVDAKRAAELLGISRSMLHKLKATGRLPRPVRLGHRVLWRVRELEDWVYAGCPTMERWEAEDDGKWRAKPGLGGNRPYDREQRRAR